jgi:hypothetical protein
MTDEVHPLVTLLVARAKSHPEEFRGGKPNTISPASRWWFAVDTIRRDGTAGDKALLANTIGRGLMDEAHEWALDELMNGEQRRAEEHRRAEEEEKRYLAVQQAKSLQAQNMQAQSLQNAYAQPGLWGVNSVPPTVSADLKAQNLYEQLKQANVMGVKK